MTRFDIDKISSAINKAFFATGIDNRQLCNGLAELVLSDLINNIDDHAPQVEEIQDSVEKILLREGYGYQAKAFILYRDKRTRIREGKSKLMDAVGSILIEDSMESSINIKSPASKMLRIAKKASKNYYLRRLIPSQFSEAHNKGDIHIHNLEYYGKAIESINLPLKKLLISGFHNGCSFINPPENFGDIPFFIDNIIKTCRQDLFGEISIPFFDEVLGDFIRENLKGLIDKNYIYKGLKELIANLKMVLPYRGIQDPMISINIGLDTSKEGRLIIEALLEIFSKEIDGENIFYPKIIFHTKDGVNLNKKEPNYDLLNKAVSIACQKMNLLFVFNDNVEKISGNVEGTGVIGRVTINLPKVSFKISHKRKDYSMDSFKVELKKTLRLCIMQLIHRKNIISSLKVDEIPFVMGQGLFRGSSELKSSDYIGEVLKNGILNINFVGLWEAIYILEKCDYFGSNEKVKLALEIIDFMNQCIKNLSQEFNEKFVLSGFSSVKASERFIIIDRNEFGKRKNITDKKIYSNGFSMPLISNIVWKDRLETLGRFHKRIPGEIFSYLNLEEILNERKNERKYEIIKQSGIKMIGVYCNGNLRNIRA